MLGLAIKTWLAVVVAIVLVYAIARRAESNAQARKLLVGG